MNNDQWISPTRTSEEIERNCQRLAQLLSDRAELRKRILALFEDGAERYSVEVADQLGVSRVGLIHYLDVFERAGKLTSRFVPGDELQPPGRMGRRYFRKATT